MAFSQGDERKYRLLVSQGQANLRTGDFVRAEECFGNALSMAQQQHSPGALANAYSNIASAWHNVGRVREAEVLLLQALSIHEQYDFDDGIRQLCVQLGYIYRSTGELEKAERMANRAIEYCVGDGNDSKESRADATMCLAMICNTRSEYERSLSLLAECLEVYRELELEHGIVSSLGNAAIIHRDLGNWDAAENRLLEVLALEEHSGSIPGMANVYGNLGVLFRQKGDLEEADRYLRINLDFELKMGRKEGVAKAYCELGIVARMRGDLVQAKELTSSALGLNQEIERLEGVADQYGELGIICRLEGKYEESLDWRLKELALESDIGRVDGMANAFDHLARAHEALKDWESAIRSWQRARTLFVEAGLLAQANQAGLNADECRDRF